MALGVLVLTLCATPLAAQHTKRVRARGRRVAAQKISFAWGTQAVNIPFELYANVIFLRVRVGDSEPLWFIFDTGAGINVVNTRRAASLRLTKGVEVDAKGTGGTVAGTLATGATISLPGVAARAQRLAALPIDSIEPHVGRTVDGILGYDFIKEFVVEIDYERSLISFYDPRTYRYAGRGASVPIEIRGGTPFVRTTVDLTSTDSVAGEFEIDTGSDGALGVYDYFVKARGLLRRLPRASLSKQTGAGVGGDTSFVEARVKDLRLGRFRIENPVVSLSVDEDEGERPKYDGMIGTEVFRRFRVHLDYARRRLILEPNSHFREPYESDMSGVDVVAEGADFRTFRITGVKPNSPGAQAGLREGDVLTQIDGRAAAEFTLDEISRMFTRDGREYALAVRRGEETLRTAIKLRRRI
jgi:hypothetical protein